ncbi:MAG: ATP-binding protein [Bacteroidales bacterium]|nr:ATP-binding protein [Bacteroidales bacterium]
MIDRLLKNELLRLSKVFPVITLTGPRQSGKTTLCKSAFPDYHYISLENIDSREAMEADTLSILRHYGNGLIIDEVQHLPEVFSYIQVAVDEDRDRHFILTGSSNFSLLESVSQSLAGRTAVLTLLPLSLEEIKDVQEISTDTLMLRGCYPAVWAQNIRPADVYAAYHATYVERDLRHLINIRNISGFRQFLRLSAGRCSCMFVPSDFANELGVDMKTIQHWNSILETSYITFLLPPYFHNIGKRITKTPKRYFYDTGFLCYLLGIEKEDQLETHPLRGAIFENYVVSEMVKQHAHRGMTPHLFYYRDKSQNEVDLIREQSFGQLQAYEIKSSHAFHPAFFKGTNYFQQLYKEKLVSSCVLYDGDEISDISYKEYCNFRNVPYFKL